MQLINLLATISYKDREAVYEWTGVGVNFEPVQCNNPIYMQIYQLRSPLQCSESFYCSDTLASQVLMI